MSEQPWETAWRELPDGEVNPELLELTGKHVAGELSSTDTLATRLTAVVTFSGALLAVGITLSGAAAKARLSYDARVVFSIVLVIAVGLLAAAILNALTAVTPRPRSVPNPERLRHYIQSGTPIEQIRRETFQLYGVTLEAIGHRNRQVSRAVRRSLVLVALALLAAAAAALIVYFNTPWPTTTPNKAATATPATRATPIRP